MCLLVAILLGYFLTDGTTLATAKDDPFGLGVPEMTVVRVRSTKPGCEPICPEWISAEGTITSNSVKKFTRVLKGLGELKLPVILQSPGGDIAAAIAIGRMIRRKGLDVGVGKTQFFGCAPLDKSCRLPASQNSVYGGTAQDVDAYCFSACPLILSGGVNRIAGPSTHIGVHQPITKQTPHILKYAITFRVIKGKKHILSKRLISNTAGKTRVRTGVDKALRAMLEPYLKEMGISQQLIIEMAKAPPTEIYQPGIVMNDELGLTTSRFTLLALAGNSNCSPPKQAANCVASNK